ncbi:glycosyltransferase family 2 protein [Arcobacter sp. F2176]|uniref:glycosyltransferase family 2 protein n=1 Tax=Arcobacter sp. F2176 TaxID=2044511 RepID=UPI00100A944C|nr:glycosyltransferase family 2 protein [Arcobacter sp. F2176]
MNKLTIYIPTYNRAESVLKQLNLIKTINNDNITVIVSDNCSTDRIGYEKVKAFCLNNNILYIKNFVNVGADANIFNGFIVSQNSKYIWILSDDDLLKKDAVERVLEILNNNNFDLLFFTFHYIENLSYATWNQADLYNKNIKISDGSGLISNVIYKSDFIKESIPIGFQHIYTCFAHLAILIDSFYNKTAEIGRIGSSSFFVPETNLPPAISASYSKSYFGFVLLAELFEDKLKKEFIIEWSKFKNLRHWFIKKRDKIASQNSIYAKAYISNYSFFFKFKLLIWYFLTPLFLVLKKYKNR